MAQLYSTGPVPVWIGLGSNGAPLFLGHAERWPRIRWRTTTKAVYTDRGGQQIPHDMMKYGADAFVMADIVRFNESAYQLVAESASLQASPVGDIGTMVVAEMGRTVGAAYPIWLPFPYQSKQRMATMEQGYHFFAAVCVNSDLDRMGTMPTRKRLVWHCLRIEREGSVLKTQPGSAIGGAGGSTTALLAGAKPKAQKNYFLYDYDVDAVKNRPIN